MSRIRKKLNKDALDEKKKRKKKIPRREGDFNGVNIEVEISVKDETKEIEVDNQKKNTKKKCKDMDAQCPVNYKDAGFAKTEGSSEKRKDKAEVCLTNEGDCFPKKKAKKGKKDREKNVNDNGTSEIETERSKISKKKKKLDKTEAFDTLRNEEIIEFKEDSKKRKKKRERAKENKDIVIDNTYVPHETDKGKQKEEKEKKRKKGRKGSCS